MLGVFNAINGAAPAERRAASGGCACTLRENCVVGIPRHPASCSVATCNMPDRIGNAVQRAIAELAEGFGMAEVGYSTPASVGGLSGRDPRAAMSPFIDQLVLGWTGGAGGPVRRRVAHDGRHRRCRVLQRDSVELDELRFPLRIDTHRIVPDTEGAGRRRGAPAAETKHRLRPTRTSPSSTSATAPINPPAGARGGVAGRSRVAGDPERSRGRSTEAGVCARVVIRPGEARPARACNGGGGYGDALLREPARVADRPARGLRHPQPAPREVYGVVFDAHRSRSMTAATEALRRDLARSPRRRIVNRHDDVQPHP